MDKIKEAVQVLKKGGIVIFPTDTAFGVGCRIDDQKTIERLFEIRKRPHTQATPVLVHDLEMASQYVKHIPEEIIERLIKPYWPGALTIVLPCKIEKVPSLVRGGGKNIGIRIPNHPVTLELIKSVGVPILGPSANFHGEKTPYKLEDLDKNLVRLVDYVIKGDCMLKKPSTVIDVSEKAWTIVRQGAIKIQSASRRTNIKNNTVLFIDSSSNKEIIVKLKRGKKEFTLKRNIGREKAQVVLPMIDELIKKKGLALTDLESIEVNTKQGSFTGVRVGLSIANALSFTLKIPVKKI